MMMTKMKCIILNDKIMILEKFEISRSTTSYISFPLAISFPHPVLRYVLCGKEDSEKPD
jgi:hypothetical protein